MSIEKELAALRSELSANRRELSFIKELLLGRTASGSPTMSDIDKKVEDRALARRFVFEATSGQRRPRKTPNSARRDK